jgi:hypothetical protein
MGIPAIHSLPDSDLLGGMDVIDQEDHSYYMGGVNNGCGLGEQALR